MTRGFLDGGVKLPRIGAAAARHEAGTGMVRDLDQPRDPALVEPLAGQAEQRVLRDAPLLAGLMRLWQGRREAGCGQRRMPPGDVAPDWHAPPNCIGHRGEQALLATALCAQRRRIALAMRAERGATEGSSDEAARRAAAVACQGIGVERQRRKEESGNASGAASIVASWSSLPVIDI